MKSEIEVTKIFVYYVRDAIIHRSFEIYRQQKNKVETVPYDTWLIDQLIRSEAPHLLERMSFNDIWNIEDFIENDQLALAISMLTIRQKFIIYWKFVEEASDQQIGELLGISSQAVSKQKRHTLGILAEAFFKF